MFEAIFFDLGLTLIFPSTHKDAVHVLREMGYRVKEEEVQRAFSLTDHYFFHYYPGVLNQDVESFFPWYGEVVARMLGIDFFVPDFVKTMMERYPPRSQWILYDDTLPTLEELYQQRLYLGLITNWDISARRIIEEKGIAKYFKTIVVSAEEGVEKPDPRIFKKAMEYSNLKPGQILYVGDNYWDDIEGAAKAGVQGVLINRNPYSSLEHKDLDCPQITELSQVLQVLNPT